MNLIVFLILLGLLVFGAWYSVKRATVLSEFVGITVFVFVVSMAVLTLVSLSDYLAALIGK
jgi:hypothetical protein